MLRVKRGDTKPDVVFYDVRDQEGNIIDLAAVQEVRVVCRRKGEFLFDRLVTGTSDGTATLPWQVGDTDEVGRLKMELKVIFLTGDELTIPSEGHFNIEVTQDLDRPES